MKSETEARRVKKGELNETCRGQTRREKEWLCDFFEVRTKELYGKTDRYLWATCNVSLWLAVFQAKSNNSFKAICKSVFTWNIVVRLGWIWMCMNSHLHTHTRNKSMTPRHWLITSLYPLLLCIRITHLRCVIYMKIIVYY